MRQNTPQKSTHYSNSKTKKITLDGRIKIVQNGNALFVSKKNNSNKELFINKSDLNTALHRDAVRIQIERNKGGATTAKVTQILKRFKTEISGIITKKDGVFFLKPSDSKIKSHIIIPEKHLEGARKNEKVIVKIIEWGHHKDSSITSVVKTILGKTGNHQAEIQGIITDNGIQEDFPKEVLTALASEDFSIPHHEINRRRDFRNKLTFTIDPIDAKDFDDALSFEILPSGNTSIGVHIADVSYYVKPESEIDIEAYKRGTSVYLVDRVIPMLPTKLSNDICSLNPNEDKLTFSVIFEIDKQNRIVNIQFEKTIINSDYRFSYEEVQHVIKNKTTNIPKTISLYDKSYKLEPQLKDAFISLDTIAKSLRSQRVENGAISFDKIETNFVLDETGFPKSVKLKESLDAHKLIEEYMLLANKYVAEYIGKHLKKTFVYRIHDQPDTEKLNILKGIISKFGYSINTSSRKKTTKSLNKLLFDIKGRKEQNLIDTLTIRSMSKAIYSTENIGHYGLAFDFYTHFTSPIRRYPDLITHRLLDSYLKGGKKADESVYQEICDHCSTMEEYAVATERDSLKYMQVKYLEQFIGKSFYALISGVTERGIFVEIIENKCEGFIRVKDLKNDFYYYDSKSMSLIGKSSGIKLQLGDEVKIIVKKANLEKRHLDFQLA